MSESSELTLNTPAPQKPLMLYDGDCHFCRYWIRRWQSVTEGRVEFEPYQERGMQYREIPAERYQKSVQLILPDGIVSQGALAVFQALAQVPNKNFLLKLYQYFPPFRFISELIYRVVAANRKLFSMLTKIVWGKEINDRDYFVSRWIFLRSLAIIYFMAFVSLGVQVSGLMGSNGIAPMSDYLERIAEQVGSGRLWMLPSVFWLNSSDFVLTVVCYGGALLALFVLWGRMIWFTMFLMWAFYLSIVNAGGVFLSYQWDILLVEVGFLAIFLAPLQNRSDVSREAPPSRLILFLFKLLLFKLMFTSGVVKGLSGDEVWANFTALNYHYETQPIPTWTSWYAHQLPEIFQKFSVFSMFLVEIFVPFFIFFPRRIRYGAGILLIFLQICILATGNYCFFNWLSIALCLFLFDDSFWPQYWRDKVVHKRKWSKDFPGMAWPKFMMMSVGVLVVYLTLMTWPSRLGFRPPWPDFVKQGARWFQGFQFVNNYGLFAVMTTKRSEIIVQGSMDGSRWETYEFKYKPGDLSRRPVFVAPHQPRLDWQMWFAALNDVRRNPWFIKFCVKLLEGSKPVLSLIENNPFPDEPPRYIRAKMYDYYFTNFDEKSQSGDWWKRDNERDYLPAIGLRR